MPKAFARRARMCMHAGNGDRDAVARQRSLFATESNDATAVSSAAISLTIHGPQNAIYPRTTLPWQKHMPPRRRTPRTPATSAHTARAVREAEAANLQLEAGN